MLNVSALAKRCGLSRSTLLYYESIGLLEPARAASNGYRRYSERDLRRIEQICAYRNAGLKLQDVSAIIKRPDTDAASVLKRRLIELDAEIETKRRHQRAIVSLLKNKSSLGADNQMTKEKWTSIMRSAGFSQADMHRWHIEFERSAPDDHQQFLEYLHIPAAEIDSIRNWSRRSEPQV